MAKVTSKLQVTVPKAVADQFGIRPGTELTWIPAGDAIRIVPPRGRQPQLSREARLELFDSSTERQRRRTGTRRRQPRTVDRGWTREDLYRRGRAR